jgi:ureidoglycolate lyase
MTLEAANLAYAPSTGVHRAHETPVILASETTLKGFGSLVTEPEGFAIDIVRWPAQGWRPIDSNSGDQGGLTEGEFAVAWHGDTLYGHNGAVGDSYLFGWSLWPEMARADGKTAPRHQALVWRANYHPDGGQLVFPLGGESFLVSLAPPGDDVRPENFVTFRIEDGRGLYIAPGIWHGPFIPLADEARFFDRQGRVHARVSVDFVKEFGVYLAVPLSNGASAAI